MLVGNLLPRSIFFHAAKSARMNARVPGRYFAGINRRALRHASLNSLASDFMTDTGANAVPESDGERFERLVSIIFRIPQVLDLDVIFDDILPASDA